MRPPARAAIWASALAVAAFEVVGTFGATSNQPERKDLTVLAIVLVLIGPAALAVRDRFPRAAAAAAIGSTLVYLALGYAYGPIFVSIVVALVWLVLLGKRTDAWVLAGLGYGGFIVADLIDDRSGGSTVHWALVAGWLVVILVVADQARIRRDQRAAVIRAERAAQERRAGDQRLALAQELHDVLAHNISLMNVQASVALHLLDQQPEQARPALSAIKHASHEALEELRTALDLLRDGDAAPRTPAPRLRDLAELVEGVRGGGLPVRLDQEPEPDDLPAAVQLAAYRIVQEALTNVTRHARAGAVTVTVRYAGGVTIEVLDDGVGGVPVPGNGLSGMRERAAALGGTVDAGPAAGGGFRVRAHLPVRA